MPVRVIAGAAPWAMAARGSGSRPEGALLRPRPWAATGSSLVNIEPGQYCSTLVCKDLGRTFRADLGRSSEGSLLRKAGTA